MKKLEQHTLFYSITSAGPLLQNPADNKIFGNYELVIKMTAAWISINIKG